MAVVAIDQQSTAMIIVDNNVEEEAERGAGIRIGRGDGSGSGGEK